MPSNLWVWRAVAADTLILSLWTWMAFRVRWVWPSLYSRIASYLALLAACPISFLLVEMLVKAQNHSVGVQRVFIDVGLLLPFLAWLVSVGLGFLLSGSHRRVRSARVHHAA